MFESDVYGCFTYDYRYSCVKLLVSGMGCFWGAERKFWTQKGVISTQVLYLFMIEIVLDVSKLCQIQKAKHMELTNQ